MRGALGYALPGSGVRFEIGGFYVTAKGSSSQTTTLPANTGAVLLNGANPGGNPFGAFLCGGAGGFTCTAAGSFSASYDAWQVSGKLAVDRKFGSTKISPFVGVFGGTTRNSESLSQAFTQFFGGAVFRTGTFSASTALHWTDAGGRAGLDISVPVTGAMTFGVGAWVGGASRTVSLSGSDLTTSPIGAFNGVSTISAGANKGVLLANAEAGLAYALSQTLTLRGFGGANYDGSVPGIASPSFSGPSTAPTAGTPASIAYAAETSYCAGGGFEAHF